MSHKHPASKCKPRVAAIFFTIFTRTIFCLFNATAIFLQGEVSNCNDSCSRHFFFLQYLLGPFSAFSLRQPFPYGGKCQIATTFSGQWGISSTDFHYTVTLCRIRSFFYSSMCFFLTAVLSSILTILYYKTALDFSNGKAFWPYLVQGERE